MFLLIADLDPLHVALTAFAFAGSTFFAPLLLAIWWPRCTMLGTFAALGAGFLVVLSATVISASGIGSLSITTATASLIALAVGLAAGIAASLLWTPPSEAEAAFCEEMRDPEGKAIYDRAQQRAAAAAAAAAAQAAASQ
jgi:Na+(H+)/acetate symporter ActP